MDIGIVSTRYAKALMGYAMQAGVEDRLYEEVKMLETSLRHHPELRAALGNPTLPAEEKRTLIRIAAVGRATLSDELDNFIGLVLKNGREDMLHYICLSFMELYRKARHIGVGRLVTAVPVSREMEERIRRSAAKTLHARMELQTIVDPSIEGGFVFDINDYRLDASIATQLKRVKEQFIEKNRRIV